MHVGFGYLPIGHARRSYGEPRVQWYRQAAIQKLIVLVRVAYRPTRFLDCGLTVSASRRPSSTPDEVASHLARRRFGKRISQAWHCGLYVRLTPSTGQAEVYDGLEAPHPQEIFLQRADRSDAVTPLPSGARTSLGELSIPKNAISCWKWAPR